MPKAHWPDDPDYLTSIEASWREPFGDMRQELVFIGQGLDRQVICDALDQCLLTDEQVAAGENLWRTLPDPFPVWEEARDAPAEQIESASTPIQGTA